MSERRRLRRFGVGVFTFLATAVPANLAFVLALVLAEFVALPLGVLVTAVIAAVVASWAADRLAADKLRTDINAVVTRSTAWAMIPAGAALLMVFFPGLLFPVLPVTLLYTVAVATALAFRHRVSEKSVEDGLGRTTAWLAATAVIAGAVVFVASLLGLVGAGA